MKSTLNAHRLLTGTISDDGYLDNIDISQNDADELNEAKSAIRDSIRIGFRLRMPNCANLVCLMRWLCCTECRISQSFLVS